MTCLFPSRGLLSAGGYSCRVEVTIRVYDPWLPSSVLRESGINIIPAEGMSDAAEKVVAAAK